MRVQSKPWLTQGIRNSTNAKKNLHKKYLRTKSSYYYTRFNFYRNKVNHLVRKRQYYKNYFAKNINNSKSIWKSRPIKHIIH
jgi:hypothetical protein